MFIDMTDLLEEWETSIIVMVPSEGRLEGGRWIPGKEVPEERQAVVVPLSNDDLRYDENGTYTRQDKKVYTHFPLENGTGIVYDNLQYKITDPKDYSAHSNVYVYFAKRIEQGGSKGMG